MTDPVPPASLLLSMPQMLDPNFMHTVLLLVDHTPEGAFGLVVNRALDVAVADLFPERPELEGSGQGIYVGGPVDGQSLHFVHRLPDRIPGGLAFGNGLFLGGPVDAMLPLVGGQGSDDLRLFLGYSGWGAGQLDGELQEGAWQVAPPNPDLVFSSEPPEALWRQALAGLGPEGAHLSRLPPDVRWN